MLQKTRLGSSDSVRSVARAIELLEALNRRPVSTLGDLHHQTGLPKSSILRLLRTLDAKGLVAQTSSYGSYRLLGSVKSLSCGFPDEPLIVEVAERLMIDFTEREGWPLALALFDAGAMVVRASTIPYTSLCHAHSSLHVRLNLFDFALGHAYLAHCSPGEQKKLLDLAARDMDSSDRARLAAQRIEDILERVRDQGYAVRDQRVIPESSTIAVPVYKDGNVVASLGLTWLVAAMPVQQAIDHYVPRLLAIADDIARGCGTSVRGKQADQLLGAQPGMVDATAILAARTT